MAGQTAGRSFAGNRGRYVSSGIAAIGILSLSLSCSRCSNGLLSESLSEHPGLSLSGGVMGLHRVPRILCVFLVALVAGRVAAQDLTPGLTYVCSGERLFIENCNMRDLSDTASCMVGHPDHIL